MRRAIGAVVVLLAVALVGGIAYGRGTHGGTTPARANDTSAAEFVVVQSRTISSVLVLDGTVVANPLFRVVAPRSGTLVMMPGEKVGIVPARRKTAKPVKLPAHSKAVNLLVEPGTKVEAGVPILDAQLSGFALQATVPAEKLHRLYTGVLKARGEITNGPGPFECSGLGVPFVPASGMQLSVAEAAAVASANIEAKKAAAAAKKAEAAAKESTATPISSESAIPPAPVITHPVYTAAQPSTTGSIVVCTVPAGLQLVEGLPCLVALTTAQSVQAIALPVEAVAGISQRGQVFVIAPDGSRATREVTLGITDGTYVQITKGLAEGDKVALPSPSISSLEE